MPDFNKMTRPSAYFSVEKLKALLLQWPLSHEEWLLCCSPSIHLRIGNANATVTRDAAMMQLQLLLTKADSFGHSYCDTWQRRDMIVVETDISFLDTKAMRRVIPCVITCRAMEGLLIDLRFYLDPSPLPGVGEVFQLGKTVVSHE
jgi:hypothetical protein